MKIIDIDFKEDGKKYFCKDVNEVFEIKEGNLIAATRSFSMAELLKIDFEEIKEGQNPYTRVDYRKRYYNITGDGCISFLEECGHNYDKNMFNIANYFNNKEYAKYMAFKETLMRRLDRFAWENNETAINWTDNSIKYCIEFNYKHNELAVVWASEYKSSNVYFTSGKIANKAIEEFKEDLIKLYTWKFDS